MDVTMTHETTQKLTVMLVEDDRTQRTLIAEVLTRLGCFVVTASDGRSALAQLMQGPCDLVLMDVEMPRLNGIETARAMAAMQHRGEIPAIPIIALTGSTRGLMRENCRAAGMEEILIKTGTPSEWNAALTELLGRWFPKVALTTFHERTA